MQGIFYRIRERAHPSPPREGCSLCSRAARLGAIVLAMLAGPALGEERWGQPAPGLVAEVFAPGIVSKPDRHEFGSVFSRDGRELYFGVDVGSRSEIWHQSFEERRWGEATPLLTHGVYSYNDPFLDPEERRLYFISDRPLDDTGEAKDIDIWFVERLSSGWSEPRHGGPTVNSSRDEYYVSFTREGALYFASNRAAGEGERGDFDLYSSRREGGEHQEPVLLGPSVNTRAYEADVFVAPDESYLIFSAQRHGGRGRGDLYISFRGEDGGWTKAKNMGEAVNTEGHELCPFVTADGAFLFYTSRQDIYWIDAKVLETLR